MTPLSVVDYRIEHGEDMQTPALAIYPEIVDRNIAVTVGLLGGDSNRWRPHLKTAKLGFTMRRLVERGVTHAKCATTGELVAACEAGMQDMLIAFPLAGANARRVREIGDTFPAIRISVLAEGEPQIDAWKGSRIGIFIDVNSGMNRTGIEQDHIPAIIGIARSITAAGQAFRGLHYYDGQITSPAFAERETLAHRGYNRVMEIAAALSQAGLPVEEVITSGTPAFPAAASYPGFRLSLGSGRNFVHRVSPGTVIYGDMTSTGQFPEDYGYRPAALVLSTVVSHPKPGLITCDAGHKSVSADAGVPTCEVVGRPDLKPLKPSEEHLPMEVAEGATPPAIGELLYLLPRHICPSVNNFDDAVIVVSHRIVGIEKVTARGHEPPLREAVTGRRA